MKPDDRSAAEARWLALTRRELPAVAPARCWPVRSDHCFQRIFLDNACRGVWYDHVTARPAYAHADRALLDRAISLAEAALAGAVDLAALNRRSLAWRRQRARRIDTAPVSRSHRTRNAQGRVGLDQTGGSCAMTTYPLSEPATLHRGAGVGDTRGEPGKAVTHGTLADCAEILAGWAAGERANARIDMDDMSLRYGPDEIEELLQFLRNEAADQPAESRRSGD